MHTRYSVKWILLGALMMPGLTACSFFGDDEAKTEEVAANGEENPADAGESAGEENQGMDPTAEEISNSEAPMPPDDSALAAADAAAASNSAPAASSDIPAELLAGAAPTGEMEAPMDPNAAPMGSVPEAAAPPMAAAAPGDVRVYYVNVSALPLRDKPDGQSVGNLAKGDPVLVKIEGNWANVLNRGWVELASLSMGPIGRGVSEKSWN